MLTLLRIVQSTVHSAGKRIVELPIDGHAKGVFPLHSMARKLAGTVELARRERATNLALLKLSDNGLGGLGRAETSPSEGFHILSAAFAGRAPAGPGLMK